MNNYPPGCTPDDIDRNFDDGWGEWETDCDVPYDHDAEFPFIIRYVDRCEIPLITEVNLFRSNRLTGKEETDCIDLYLAKMTRTHLYYSASESFLVHFTESDDK